MSETGAEARLRRMAGEAPDEGAGSYILLAAVLALVCLLVRVQNLMALPIFGDEAIYLRWAQLIRAGHFWVSLADPKPPLHFWLIAAVYGWAKDPLEAARGISVAAGVLSIPAVMGVCAELGHLLRRAARVPAASGKAAGAMAAILLIFSPFVSFYQRFATADALFCAEMLLAAWAALAWARLGWSGRRAAWAGAMALGVVMGAAMMTRQGLSYTLWALPLLALVLGATHRPLVKPVRKLAGLLLQLLLAGAIAGALWAPFLTANLANAVRDAQADAPAGVTVTTGDVIRRRVLYQEKFTAEDHRAQIAERNFHETFLPTFTNDWHRADRGWMWTYLTWPVYLAGLAGLVWLLARGQWRVAAVLLAWLFLMLGPVVLLGSVVYSRYVLAGAVVLVVAAGWFLADMLSVLFLLRSQALAWLATAGVLVGILWMPLREIGRQTTDWRHITLTQRDRYQYLTGWTSGQATVEAVRFVQGLARGIATGPASAPASAPATTQAGEHDVVVITDTAWGLPADALWVYLAAEPNVRVYWTSRNGEAVLIPVEGGVEGGVKGDRGKFWLRPEKWLFLPQEKVAIPPGALVLYVTNDPIHASDGDHRAAEALGKLNPGLKLLETFHGIEGSVEQGADDQVQVFQVQ